MKKIALCMILFIGIITPSNSLYSQTAPTEALFEIKNDAGQTVFAVYPGGVHIFIDDQLKAKGGGFTVGRIGTEKAAGDEYFIVNPNDVRINLDDQLKAKGGGFTVGRIGTEKASGDIDYLTVTPDSTRVYTSETSTGGFAVGKHNTELGAENFLDLTPENYFIGHNSGANNTTGLRNAFLGYQTGVGNTEGNDNIFLGYSAGYSNTYGESNIFIGTNAGYLNASEPTDHFAEGHNNVFVGDLSGYNNIHGYRNVAIGSSSGYNNNTNYNVYIGHRAGYTNTSGIQQVFIGNEAGDEATGRMNTFVGANSGSNVTIGANNCFLGTISGSLSHSASHNTFLGNQAGFRGTLGDTVQSFNTFVGSSAGYSENGDIGSSNTLIGYQAGFRNGNNLGHGNIFIGYQAGYNVSGDYHLYINHGEGAPLIWGDFENDRLRFNGTVGINTVGSSTISLAINPSSAYGLYVYGGSTSYAAYFNGNVHATGSLTSSDLRLKKNIENIISPLEKIMKLRGVTYSWDTKKYPERGFEKGSQIGVIAQEVEKIFPQLVKEDDEGYKAVAYDKLSAVLLEAIKKQQVLILNLKEENKKIKEQLSEIDKLKTEIEELKKLTKQLLKN